MFYPYCGKVAVVIAILPLLTVRAFVPVHEPTPIESALRASRREFGAALVGECIALSSGPAFAIVDSSASASGLSQSLMASELPQSGASDLPYGLLESRLSSNVLEPPPFGMEGTDIFYPS